MDSLIMAAARALAAGDPLGALNRVALRGDAPALALRGIAMAQLGDLARARTLMRDAARGFGALDAVARAKCRVAEAEIALAARDLNWPMETLAAAAATLEAHGEFRNAAHARYIGIRRALLLGQIDAAERELNAIDASALPHSLKAVHALILAGIALRRLQAVAARDALARAAVSARHARIPALAAEVASALEHLELPAARLVGNGDERALRLDEIETLLRSDSLVIDACRHVVQQKDVAISLARRPVLFALLRALGEAWPQDVPRSELIARAFRTRDFDESHRARLRVELGRLRTLLAPLADINASARGFALAPRNASTLAVLARPVEEPHATVLALLADGEAWSSSALALALGASQRSVQRALDALAAVGKAQSFGRGRARRWTMPPMPGFATSLLLSVPLSVD